MENTIETVLAVVNVWPIWAQVALGIVVVPVGLSVLALALSIVGEVLNS